MTGSRIGNYRVGRQLGAGGMGAVFEATNEQIGRRAAIKVLRADLSQNAEVSQRFLNEARAVNRIQHPGVVSVFEFGQLPDGQAYIVMELLHGMTLRERLRRRIRLGAEAIRLWHQMASALVVAHAAGIIHRDLKPDNIMLVPDPDVPGGERAKILDFGIAKVVEPDESVDAHLQTQTGVVMGTPAYMAPEQCLGARRATDRTDVYALGVILYHCIAGRLPFAADSAPALIAKHIYEPPPPLARTRSGIPRELTALIHAMLEKDSVRRPSMPQVAAALERLPLTDWNFGPLTGMASLIDRGREAWAQPLTRAALALAMAVLLFVGVGGYFGLRSRGVAAVRAPGGNAGQTTGLAPASKGARTEPTGTLSVPQPSAAATEVDPPQPVRPSPLTSASQTSGNGTALRRKRPARRNPSEVRSDQDIEILK